jgi:hypothetical protein
MDNDVPQMKAHEMHSLQDETGKLKFQYYAMDTIGVTLSQELKRSRKYTREELRNMMRSPFDNIDKIQEASRYFKATNGHYQRMLHYLAQALTLDYVLYPKSVLKMSPDMMKKGFYETAQKAKLLDIKRNGRTFLDRLWTDGEVYLYKIEDKQSIIYKEIPTYLCRASYVEDGVMRFEVSLKKITRKTLPELPLEIQNAYERNQSASNKDGKIEWYPLDDRGVCFNILGYMSKGFPPMVYLFDTLIGYEDTSDVYENSISLDNIKLIHQKVPLDKDFLPVMDGDIIKMYHEATKRALPKQGVSITTNPLDLQSVSFDRSALRTKEGVSLTEEAIYNTGGISKLLFNNVSASGEGLKKSLITDEMLSFALLPQLEAYFNYELKKSKNKSFGIKILETTYSNRADQHTACKEALAFGGSRQMFLSTQGLEPLEGINMLQMEQAIGIDDYFVPAKSAHTQSDTGDTGGRPEETDVTDAGDASRQQK